LPPSPPGCAGMKRKLSVGIAFIGDPKVVFLDGE
jgi:ABC-type multidrug transport system ATPase subunit